MPKLRIYEIAQEINKTNKEVLDFLKEKNIEVKSHMSTLEEKEEKMVRDAFAGKKEEKADYKEQKNGEDKKAADRPKKKSNLIQVYRPQNAMTQEGKNFRKNKAQQGNNRPQGNGKAQEGTPRTEGQQNGTVKTQESGKDSEY